MCVGLDKAGDMFICGACQRRTQEKTIAGNLPLGNIHLTPGIIYLSPGLTCPLSSTVTCLLRGGRQDPNTPGRPGLPGMAVTPGMHTPANQQFLRATPATTASYSRYLTHLPHRCLTSPRASLTPSHPGLDGG